MKGRLFVIVSAMLMMSNLPLLPDAAAEPVYGVSLEVDFWELAKLSFIHPGQEVGARMSVANTGNATDVVHLELDVDFAGHEADGWAVGLSETEFELEENESAPFDIMVTGPTTGSINDYIHIVLIATSEHSEDRETLDFRSFLIINHGLDIVTKDENVVMLPGGTATTTLTVLNEGDLPDDIALQISTSPPNWSFTVPDTDLGSIDAGATKAVVLTVTAPPNTSANDMGCAQVRAYIEAYPSIDESVSVCGWVTPDFVLEAWTAKDTYYVDVNGTVNVTVNVKNLGNMAGTAVIEVPTNTGSWKVEPERSAMPLGSNSGSDLLVLVDPPDGSLYGARLVVTIKVSSEDGSVFDTAVFTVIVAEIREVTATLEGDPLREAEQGDTVKFRFQVENTGDTEETFELDVNSLPTGWDAVFSYNGSKVTEVGLAGKVSKDMEMWVYVPRSAEVGMYNLTAVLGSQDKFLMATMDVTINVSELVDMELAAMGDTSKTAAPGQDVSFIILLKNTGTGEQRMSLTASFTGAPQEWDHEFKELSGGPVTFAPGEERTITLSITVDGNATGGTDQRIDVAGQVVGQMTMTIVFNVEVRVPNLRVVNVTHEPEVFNVSEPVALFVTVACDGDADVSDVTVNISVNGVEAGSVVVERIYGGGTAKMVFTIMPERPVNLVEVTVDPGNGIRESSEDDNGYSEELKVIGAGSGGGSGRGGLLPGFEAGMLMVGILLAVLVLGRRRGQ